VTRVKRFLGIARCLKEGGSITLVTTTEVSEARPDHALVNEIRRYINCTLDVNADFSALNTDASRTEKSDLILSQKDQEEAAQLREKG
jgi:transcription termination factor Rho